MRLLFGSPDLEGGVVRSRYDLLLGVVADFEIRINDQLLYREAMMPIVELAIALTDWLQAGLRASADFEFKSLEADESGAVWFRRIEGGWRIGSLYQEYPEMNTWTDEAVCEAIGEFVDRVEAWLQTTLEKGIDDAR